MHSMWKLTKMVNLYFLERVARDREVQIQNLSGDQVMVVSVLFTKVSPAAQRLVMATADSPGPVWQIKSNTLTAWRPTILSKITKKNNHEPYNMRCWKCCPPLSTYFWYHFKKCAFTRINSISEIQSISRLILAFNFSNVWGFAICIYGGTWKIKCMQWTPTH